MKGVRPFPVHLTIAICSVVICLCTCVRLAVGQGAVSAAQQGSDGATVAAAAAQAQGGEYKIHVGVNSVLVPVVVRDGQGRAIGDLTQKDFALFDQDKARAIVGFTVQKRASGETQAPKIENGTQTFAPPPSITILDTAPRMPQRFIAFLFDDMHFEPAELLRIKIVATKILSQTVGDSDMAAVVTTSGTSSGLTRDHAVLEGAVAKISPHALYHSDPRACPPIDVFQADLIVNHHNMQAMDAAKEAYTTCAHAAGSESSMSGNNGQMGGLTVGEDEAARMVRTASAQVLEVNDRDVAVTLSTVKEFVRRMGKLPGQQHTVILVSPGFLAVTPNATREKSEVLDLAARENVTISALDARGLYTTNMDASQRGGASMRDLMTGESSYYHSETMTMSEDVMAEFANGTGGTFFHNSNDLAGGFKQLAQAPEYVYLLEMSLDQVKPDGAYHRLKVKVDRDGMKVDARRGYVAPQPAKEPKRKK
jgi:VWFA-related protein